MIRKALRVVKRGPSERGKGRKDEAFDEVQDGARLAAGRAFQGYAARRRRHGDSGPRRILADFVIGAHAMQKGHPLLTLDDRFYRTAFPRLTIVRA